MSDRRTDDRAIAYVITRSRRDVDDQVLLALNGLRRHTTHLRVLVEAGRITPESLEKLSEIADVVSEIDAITSVSAAYRIATEQLKSAAPDVAEILLTNDTWFGPLHDLGAIFDRMAERKFDAWSMTDRIVEGSESNADAVSGGEAVSQLEWYWLVLSASVLGDDQWKAFWRAVDYSTPEESDEDCERELTLALDRGGFRRGVAFGAADFPTDQPSVANAALLIEAGCPTLRVEAFSEWPPYLAHEAAVGAWVIEAAGEAGFPRDALLQHVARNVAPKVLNANAALMSVLPAASGAYDPSSAPRVLVVAHIFFAEMTDELIDHADTLPVPYDLVVTTSDAEKAESIRRALAARPIAPRTIDVRVAESNAGRDQSAFLITCADVLRSNSHDLVVKIHSKRSSQDGVANGRFFKHQQLDNLLSSPGRTSHLLSLFQREKGLGIVFPPMIHIGMPTMGRGWASNKPGFEAMCERLGISVPLDDVSPLAPFGSMYIARPSALRRLSEAEWEWKDFELTGYGDGSLSHILERMPAYAAAEDGFHARTVVTQEYMSVSHTSLDFKLDQMAATTPGYLDEQISMLKTAGFWGKRHFIDFALLYARLHRPGWEGPILSMRTIGPRSRHLWWRLWHPSTWSGHSTSEG